MVLSVRGMLSSTLTAVLLVATAVKLLLVPSYHSTDFDVHRNWLAVTSRTPLACWYYERTSLWTLDYPPLFAYFEALLSRVVAPLAPELADALHAAPPPSASPRAVFVHRATVMASDAALVVGTSALLSALSVPPRAGTPLAALVLLSAPLLLVDHMHFQYNGMLLGLLLGAAALAIRRRLVAAALAFTALVNAKHLFVVLGPVVGVHFLAQFVLRQRSVTNLLLLLLALVAGTLLSFAPILLATVSDPLPACANGSPLEQLRQIGSRLFPFNERGLLHAYWAPNAWALYAGADLVAARATGQRNGGALTSGLVESHAQLFSVLPAVPPRVCAALTLLAMLPLLVALWRRRSSSDIDVVFVRALSYASLAAFMFGWHVHEKAILVAVVPLTFVAAATHTDRQQWLLLSAAGGAALLPLLDPARPIDRLAGAAMLALFWLVAYLALARLTEAQKPPAASRWWSERALVAYAVGALVLLPAAVHIALPLLDRQARLPFLPLMLTSIYCAAGVAFAWARASWQAVFH